MNNELCLNNYLMLLKGVVEVYIHGTLESSNESVRDELKSSLIDILSSQASTYNLMTEYGYYNINNVKNNVINQVLKKLENN